MISKEFYTNELDEARLEARQWKEAHNKQAQLAINLAGRLRAIKQVLKDYYNVDPFQDDKISKLLEGYE